MSVQFRGGRGVIAALVLAVLCVAAFLAWSRYSRPIPPPDPTRFDARIESFVEYDLQHTPPEDPIVFVGSSSIRLWPTDESFPGMPILNRGFGGSHISDVLYHMDRVVVSYAPSVVVFYAGDNDVSDGKSPERVLADFESFVKRVREACSGTHILFLSIKPSLSRWKVWPQMQEANSLIKEISVADSTLEFVDLASVLLGPDGKPDPQLFLEDDLHLNPEGYRRWTEILAPRLIALRQDGPPTCSAP